MAVTLPGLAPNVPITSDGSAASAQFMQYWLKVLAAIQSALNTLSGQQDTITAQQAQIEAQQAAQTSQLQTITRIVQSVSYTDGLTIGATAQTANATVSLSAHSRIYLDKAAVAVDAGSIADVPFGSDVLIYYDDPNRVGGAVAYAYTMNPNQAATSDANPGRVFVGEVITPANSTAPPSTGSGAGAPTRPGSAQP